VVQAPVFHGHTFAVHLDMTEAVDIEAMGQALAGEHVRITHVADDAPSNVNAAGQPDLLVSLVPDANHSTGVWLWVAADNLRLAASTAVECAETMAASRPRGKIQ
jgi:aspartate-semialdehyde dehydrogenase